MHYKTIFTNIGYSIISQIFRLVPLQKNTYLFTSFNGHYSDNPKAVSVRLHEMYPEAKIVWAIEDKYKKDLPTYVSSVNIKSMKKSYYSMVAGTIVDNVYGKPYSEYYKDTNSIKKLVKKIMFSLNGRKGQRVITTWHGTPLKKVGIDQVDSKVSKVVFHPTTMIHGNQHTCDIMNRVTFDQMNMLMLGSPRNDILFDQRINTDEIREKLGLPLKKKLIMYAPTFRNVLGKTLFDFNLENSGLNQLKSMNFDELFATLNDKFGGEWALVCRFHYFVEKAIDWDELNRKYPGRIFNGNEYDDMAEYLACMDALITDASSSMFDFALTNKPCFLFFPDVDNYEQNERGMYFSINELPFPLSKTFDEFILSIKQMNLDHYICEKNKLLKSIGSIDDGKAAERIVNYLIRSNNA